MGVRLLQVVVGERWKEVMQRVVADRKREEEQRQWIVPREVARVHDVRREVHPAAVALEMMVSQLA